MILTNPQKKAAWEMVANDWRANLFLTTEDQHTLVDVCEREFERQIEGTPHWRRDDYWRNRASMIANVKQELKGFITISFLLMAVIGWLIGKVLDWLLDTYTYNQQRARDEWN